MQSKKILIVDDEALVARSMQKTLMRAGYHVTTAHNCTEGLQAFEAARQLGAPFELALLDLNMPGFEGQALAGAGLELLSRLLDLQADFPVVILTAYDEVNKAREAVNRGARGFFVKGREQALVEQVNVILQGGAS
ncbi:MAG: response regulator [Chloroflexota bacterium]